MTSAVIKPAPVEARDRVPKPATIIRQPTPTKKESIQRRQSEVATMSYATPIVFIAAALRLVAKVRCEETLCRTREGRRSSFSFSLRVSDRLNQHRDWTTRVNAGL
jgi:hypothetical protein